MRAKLPKQYSYLNDLPGPRIINEALSFYGLKEVAGAGDNPLILDMAKEIGGWVKSFYSDDSIPWCGLFIGVCAKRAGFPFNQKLLGAREWLNWEAPSLTPMLGDVLVFGREGGGHVGLYVGEDETHYHVLGGNQSDEVNIMRLAKTRLLGARRCRWKISQPLTVRPIHLRPDGQVSENEA